MLARLGVTAIELRPFTLADERQIEYDVGMTLPGLDGRSFQVLTVFGEDDSRPLLGAVALETFGLAIDPVRQRLVSVAGLLMAEH